MNKSKYKCMICKGLIESEELHREQKKDKDGNLRFSKNNVPLYNNYHKNCFHKSRNEKLAFNDLYDYLLEKFFAVKVPIVYITYLRTILRKDYDYNTMLGCFKFIESTLMYYMQNKEFNDGQHKINYINRFLLANIDFYYSKELRNMQTVNDNSEYSPTEFLKESEKNKKEAIIVPDLEDLI